MRRPRCGSSVTRGFFSAGIPTAGGKPRCCARRSSDVVAGLLLLSYPLASAAQAGAASGAAFAWVAGAGVVCAWDAGSVWICRGDGGGDEDDSGEDATAGCGWGGARFGFKGKSMREGLAGEVVRRFRILWVTGSCWSCTSGTLAPTLLPCLARPGRWRPRCPYMVLASLPSRILSRRSFFLRRAGCSFPVRRMSTVRSCLRM